ncbi:MAG: hypothetical protein ACO1SV_24260 [Fimbriimonas sp.]
MPEKKAEFHAKPEPNVGSPGPSGDPLNPPPLAPQDGGEPAADPEGTTDAEFMRNPTPAERPNGSSAPE